MSMNRKTIPKWFAVWLLLLVGTHGVQAGDVFVEVTNQGHLEIASDTVQGSLIEITSNPSLGPGVTITALFGTTIIYDGDSYPAGESVLLDEVTHDTDLLMDFENGAHSVFVGNCSFRNIEMNSKNATPGILGIFGSQITGSVEMSGSRQDPGVFEINSSEIAGDVCVTVSGQAIAANSIVGGDLTFDGSQRVDDFILDSMTIVGDVDLDLANSTGLEENVEIVDVSIGGSLKVSQGRFRGVVRICAEVMGHTRVKTGGGSDLVMIDGTASSNPEFVNDFDSLEVDLGRNDTPEEQRLVMVATRTGDLDIVNGARQQSSQILLEDCWCRDAVLIRTSSADDELEIEEVFFESTLKISTAGGADEIDMFDCEFGPDADVRIQTGGDEDFFGYTSDSTADTILSSFEFIGGGGDDEVDWQADGPMVTESAVRFSGGPGTDTIDLNGSSFSPLPVIVGF